MVFFFFIALNINLLAFVSYYWICSICNNQHNYSQLFFLDDDFAERWRN